MSLKIELQNFMDVMALFYSAGDTTGCAAMFKPNGELISAHEPTACGRSEIEDLHQVWTAGVGNKNIQVVDFGGTDELAWCLAIFT